MGRPPSIDVTACVRRAKRQKLIFHRVTGTVSAIAVWYHDKYVDEDANQDYGLLWHQPFRWLVLGGEDQTLIR